MRGVQGVFCLTLPPHLCGRGSKRGAPPKAAPKAAGGAYALNVRKSCEIDGTSGRRSLPVALRPPVGGRVLSVWAPVAEVYPQQLPSLGSSARTLTVPPSGSADS